jgi:DNA-binding NtrC family response regulator
MPAKLPALTLADLERQRIEECLADHSGNRTYAADELGISARTLQRKLKAWGVPGYGHRFASRRESAEETESYGQ